MGEGRLSIHFRTSSFETSSRHPNRDVKWAARCKRPVSNREVWAEDINPGTLIFRWYLSHEAG